MALFLALYKLLLFSCQVLSDSVQPHGVQHNKLPCTSLSPKSCSNSCPLSRWCMPSIHLILCCPLLLPSILPSIRVFSSEWALCSRWPKYQSFSFSISPSNEYSGLISFRIDWFDLCCPVGSQISSLAPLFESINSLALSLLYGPTLTSIHDHRKTIALIIWTFFGNVMSLLFNTLSRFVIVFLPRSKHLLISWLLSQCAWYFVIIIDDDANIYWTLTSISI